MTSPRPPRIVVVGAGIAGLAAAAAIRRSAADAEVLVLEAAPQIGGKLMRAEVGGVVVDVGAESMLARRPEGMDLAREAGLGEQVVHPTTTQASLWSRGRMVSMPPTLMGAPRDLPGLRDSGVLSEQGLARAAREGSMPLARPEADVSVGELVEERFGAEVVDRLVEPLLGGVYAGHARELSARAAVPQLLAALAHGPLLGSAPPASTGPVFAGVAGGLGRLPEAVARHAGAEVRTGVTVREVGRDEQGWRLLVGPTVSPEVVSADAVVLATPARPTARLLAHVAPVAARELASIDYASMAIVTLAYATHDLPETTGSGFLVPPVDGRAIKASTLSFAKWDWVREAGDGTAVLRCSLGRHREESTLQRSDEDLAALARHDLADALGLAAEPIDTHVQRWGGALPQYAVGHLDRVARIRVAVAEVAGLAVCGAAYDGVGIPACIASAELAATQVLTGLSPRGE